MGGDGQAFWSLTPREIKNVLDAHAERLKREHNGQAWLAWHIEALARQKRLPKLKSLMIEGPKQAGRVMRPVTEGEVRSWLMNAKRPKRAG